jgi:hypothetical protein
MGVHGRLYLRMRASRPTSLVAELKKFDGILWVTRRKKIGGYLSRCSCGTIWFLSTQHCSFRNRATSSHQSRELQKFFVISLVGITLLVCGKSFRFMTCRGGCWNQDVPGDVWTGALLLSPGHLLLRKILIRCRQRWPAGA